MVASVKEIGQSFYLCLMLFVASFFAVPYSLAQSLPDPTRPYGTMYGKGGSSANSASSPVLQSVLITPQRRMAIISGHSVTVGEKFGEAKVIKITETEVTLAQGREVQVVKLFSELEKRPSVVAVTHQLRDGANRNK